MLTNRHSIEDSLKKVPLFSQCSRRELTQIARLSTRTHVRAGKEVTAEGAVGREFLVIVSGTATVRKDGVEVAKLGPGDHFGEVALLGRIPRTATVVADTDLVVDAFNRHEFASLLDSSPTLAREMLVSVASRLPS